MQLQRNSIKVIKAPKFSNKAYEKSIKVSNKPGRNEVGINKNFWFVFQPMQDSSTAKNKIRLSSKRNSIASSIWGTSAHHDNLQVSDDSKHDHRKRQSIVNSKLKINIKNKDACDNSRYAFMRRSSMEDHHQRSNNDPNPNFGDLLDNAMNENNAATERHISSWIDNFDQSDFIRNVIIQSKKVGGNRFGSPGQSNNGPSSTNPFFVRKKDKTFMKDMKKHGILKAFNDINKFTEFFQNSPSCHQESLEGNGMSYKHFSSTNLDSENQNSSMLDISNAANNKNTKSSYLLDEMEKEDKQTNEATKNLKSIRWIFPFQRRARSHSPPKNSVISNKIIESMNYNSPDSILDQSSIHKDSENTNEKGKNKAVVANPNFLIGSYHLLNKRNNLNSYITEASCEEEPMLQCKEVEEWLMGSGLSIPGTTGCTDNSDGSKNFSANLSGFLSTFKQKKVQKEQLESPRKKSVDEWGELEEWMFDSVNEEKELIQNPKEAEEDTIPDEGSMDNDFFGGVTDFEVPSKKSPYLHKDQIVEEAEELENEFVDPSQQFGFKNLNSYISQMDQWIEEGRTFK